MFLILLGPPGSGKGTQAAAAAAALKLPVISTGELFRAEVARSSLLGRKVKPILDAGRLVPDSLTIRILQQRIAHRDCRTGFILDGFPRTLVQARALERIARVTRVLNLTVSQRTLLARFANRLTCPACSAIYNTESKPPKRKGICDRCSAKLARRPDDAPSAVRTRLRIYRQQTAPLIAYYKKKSLLVPVDAEGSVAAVRRRVLAALRKPS